MSTLRILSFSERPKICMILLRRCKGRAPFCAPGRRDSWRSDEFRYRRLRLCRRLYATTLRNYPELVHAAPMTETANIRAFLPGYGRRNAMHLDEILADPAVDIVLNSTNPRAITINKRQCLEAGKHVYSEKPLAMTAEAGGTR